MVDWCQEGMGFLAFALLLPQSSETGGSAEFPGFRLLVLGYPDGVLETDFGFCGIACRLLEEECAFETVQFGFVPSFTRFVHDRQRFRERCESYLWLSEEPMGFGEKRQKI
jgi:hypothetical protein